MGASAKNHKNNFTIKYQLRTQRYYHYFATGLGAFLIAYVAASLLAPVQISDAAQLVDIKNTNTGYYVSVTGSSALNVSTSTTPDGALFGTADTVNTKTNSPRGYKLYISASPNYLYLNGDASTASQGKFSPVGTSLTAAAGLGINTWGFAFNPANTGVVANNFVSASNYVPEGAISDTDDTIIPTGAAIYASVPDTDTLVQSVDEANLPNGTNLDVYFGFKAGTSLPTGNYQGTITYTALSDGVNQNDVYMQDFTTEMCNNLTAATAENYNDVKVDLIDKRDMKWYSVAKMKDGNCWMTQNLALDGMNSEGAVRTLTPEDSNVTQNRTLAVNIENGTTSDADAIQIYSGDAETTTTDCSSYAYCVVSDAPYGNYYNWKAATAGTGTASTNGTAFESVCPKGWRLPDNGTASGLKSYSNLAKAYNLGDGTNTVNSSYVLAIQQPPLNFPLAGSTTATYQGILGYYWSRTAVSDLVARAYFLYFGTNDSGTFYPQDRTYKTSLLSVRCVFEGDTIQNNMFMQDINLTMCSNLAESTSSSDNRRTVVDARDSKTYRVSHLEDGNCWMVQNLALDGGRTLQPTDSNVTQNRTLNANISDGTASVNTTDQIYAGNASTQDSNDSYYGNLYNFMAATAKVGEADTEGTIAESVCPLNWRLPDNSIEDGSKSYSNLVIHYTTNIDGTGTALTPTQSFNTAMVARIQLTPLYFPLAGVYNSSADYQGQLGGYWSRTTVQGNSAQAYDLYFRTSTKNFNPQNNSNKPLTYSVRCVLGE